MIIGDENRGGRRHKDIVVVGAGLLGLTTAVELQRRGFRTTVLEAHDGVAQGASFANGSILTPSMSDPWNAPGVHYHLLASIFNARSPMKLRLGALPSLVGWGPHFLWNSRRTRHEAATRASFRLAHYSVQRLRAMRDDLALHYDATVRGTLKIFRNAAELIKSRRIAQLLRPLGLEFQELDQEATVQAEPALSPLRGEIAGALRFPDDESGDAFQFCKSLERWVVRNGGVIRTACAARRIRVSRGRVYSIETDTGSIEAPAVVVAAGVATPSLLRPLGIRLGIRPVKGYSLTYGAEKCELRPTLPVVDDARHIAVAPLGQKIRVAGTAEFAGMTSHIPPQRIESLKLSLFALFPALADTLRAEIPAQWSGLRPVSADGLPFIGPTRISGLYVNSGHGHLGWTQAAGSAVLLADLLAGTAPAIDAREFRTER